MSLDLFSRMPWMVEAGRLLQEAGNNLHDDETQEDSWNTQYRTEPVL